MAASERNKLSRLVHDLPSEAVGGRRLVIRTSSFGSGGLEAPVILASDPRGDELDALLCAHLTAWAWTNEATGFGPLSIEIDLKAELLIRD